MKKLLKNMEVIATASAIAFTTITSGPVLAATTTPTYDTNYGDSGYDNSYDAGYGGTDSYDSDGSYEDNYSYDDSYSYDTGSTDSVDDGTMDSDLPPDNVSPSEPVEPEVKPMQPSTYSYDATYDDSSNYSNHVIQAAERAVKIWDVFKRVLPEFILSQMVPPVISTVSLFSLCVTITDKNTELSDDTISLSFSGMTGQMTGSNAAQNNEKQNNSQSGKSTNKDSKILSVNVLELTDSTQVLLILRAVKENGEEPVYAELYGAKDQEVVPRDRVKVYKDLSKQDVPMNSYLGAVENKLFLYVDVDSTASEALYNVFEITAEKIIPQKEQVNKLPNKIISQEELSKTL